MTDDKPTTITRREILTGVGAAAAGGAIAFGMTQVKSPADIQADHEVDIVCVGSGCGGLTAAVTAANLGNKVLVLESAAAAGGTTNRSGGVVWIPNHYLLREQGIEDKRDECLQYMARFSYPQRYTPDSPTLGLDPEAYKLLEAFYDSGSVMVDTLRDIGVLNWAQFTVGDEIGSPPDYADHLPENKVPSGRPLVPLDADGKPILGLVGDGVRLTEVLENWLTDKGVPILVDHRVTKLIKSGEKVVGVEADNGGTTVRVRARKGVIFATGGYTHNEELVGLHQKALYGGCAVGTATGDFISIAGESGAKMGALGTAWRSQVVLEEALENREMGRCAFVLPGDSMVVVNKYGKRVFDEKRNYNDRTEVHFVYDPVDMEYPNQLMFMVFDARSADAFGGQYPFPLDTKADPYVIEGADLDDLAANIGARLAKLSNRVGGFSVSTDFTEELKSTVTQFNEYTKTGYDVEFGRGTHSYDRIWQAFFSVMREGTTEPVNDLPNNAIYPFKEAGPYYAIILAAGALDTSGGPAINDKAQILSATGGTISGLYGAGNCIASPSREAYFGAGGTIALAMTFGHIAALNASQEEA